MYFAVFLSQIALIQTQWYEGQNFEKTTTNIETGSGEVSKPVSASSPIECVLRCQRQFMDGYFVEEKQQCFCLLNKDQKIFSQDENEEQNGVLIEEHMVRIFFPTNNGLFQKKFFMEGGWRI